MKIATFTPCLWNARTPATQTTSVPAKAPDEPAAQADQVQLSQGAVGDRFREVFFRDYQERMCGQNIRRFITQFPDPKQLEGAKVLGIENKGLSYFGMVRAMNTRDVNSRGELRVTDKNWYHHVVLEKDGKIFDFDYGITPQAPGVEEYFEKMFLKCDKVRPAEKLKDYRIQVIEAQEYASARKDTSTHVSMRDYLTSWGANLARFETSP